MSKHTPGPWATDDHVSHWSIMTEDGSRHIGDVRKFGAGLQELPDGDANARLIAAAPELLTVLKEILSRQDVQDALDYLDRGVGTKTAEAVWIRARRVVAKAEAP